MAYPAKYPQLNETELTDHARTILIRVIRVAFPHPTFPDAPYERTADIILEEARTSTWLRVTLTQGLLTLDTLSEGGFLSLSDEQATTVLRRVEQTDFFGFVRRTTVLNLYDDQEVWQILGYEGESFSKGGYLNRGFDDLAWLPEPRIEEYSGPDQFDPLPNAWGTPKRHDQSSSQTTEQTQQANETAVPAETVANPATSSQPGPIAATHEEVSR